MYFHKKNNLTGVTQLLFKEINVTSSETVSVRKRIVFAEVKQLLFTKRKYLSEAAKTIGQAIHFESQENWSEVSHLLTRYNFDQKNHNLYY